MYNVSSTSVDHCLLPVACCSREADVVGRLTTKMFLKCRRAAGGWLCSSLLGRHGGHPSVHPPSTSKLKSEKKTHECRSGTDVVARLGGKFCTHHVLVHSFLSLRSLERDC